MQFDPSMASVRVAKLWELGASFGSELDAQHIYLNEWVSDRYALVNGMQLLRDELQFANPASGDLRACSADLRLPSVVTTLAHTTCGDRIHQGDDMVQYQQTVASRFATLSEIGELKIEAFSPTGGGTDDGATLAHVTVAHQLDNPLRRAVYDGNAASFVLVCIDLKTHVGRLDTDERIIYGRARESPWREPRNACGAVVGLLAHYNDNNQVHRRLRKDLGEENYAYLSTHRVLSEGGTDITATVAAAIIAIQGMKNAAQALTHELDERGVGHLTASVAVNCVSQSDPLVYLARATVFNGELCFQGFGTDARKYGARMELRGIERHLHLSYDGQTGENMPLQRSTYPVQPWKNDLPHDE